MTNTDIYNHFLIRVLNILIVRSGEIILKIHKLEYQSSSKLYLKSTPPLLYSCPSFATSITTVICRDTVAICLSSEKKKRSAGCWVFIDTGPMASSLSVFETLLFILLCKS
jgi:hypothetical protein